ncbi:hypothetical protein [Streptomyces spinosirectus]
MIAEYGALSPTAALLALRTWSTGNGRRLTDAEHGLAQRRLPMTEVVADTH